VGVARIATMIGALVGFAIGREYPGVFVQLVSAYSLYRKGKSVITRIAKANPEKDRSRNKPVYVLSVLGGLLGLLSPIIGYISAVIVFLIATERVTKEYKAKNRLISYSSIAMAICILNAAFGVVLNM
jgi:uncharacterized membrane protein YfcA